MNIISSGSVQIIKMKISQNKYTMNVFIIKKIFKALVLLLEAESEFSSVRSDLVSQVTRSVTPYSIYTMVIKIRVPGT